MESGDLIHFPDSAMLHPGYDDEVATATKNLCASAVIKSTFNNLVISQ